MNFQQLRYVRETVRQGLNLTEAAKKLHTSQPGVSKQIRSDCGDGRDTEHQNEQRRHQRAPADTGDADHQPDQKPRK